ncbi:hypothetical protein MPTP_0376 [Melissococcus plutonius ATCC 35311]|uniref:Uncharacterized protein n=1 Tax=Melissococcus plutonius (strain ATCC 35311 / DSM 29964 / CIP 104052 / LMG 20360 / NCIMB 702443) TaxID=940190 RepID=F3Y8N1_MELPT|nr:hypothetical protein MPTP_0376 [Melissococcus plutonius ATCC 35311]
MECFFDQIKHFCHVATRYDKLATSFFAFVYILLSLDSLNSKFLDTHQ